MSHPRNSPLPDAPAQAHRGTGGGFSIEHQAPSTLLAHTRDKQPGPGDPFRLATYSPRLPPSLLAHVKAKSPKLVTAAVNLTHQCLPALYLNNDEAWLTYTVLFDETPNRDNIDPYLEEGVYFFMPPTPFYLAYNGDKAKFFYASFSRRTLEPLFAFYGAASGRGAWLSRLLLPRKAPGAFRVWEDPLALQSWTKL